MSGIVAHADFPDNITGYPYLIRHMLCASGLLNSSFLADFVINTEEMSRLISGLITMCKEAQIPDREIATPEEKRLLKERYGVDV